MAKKEKSGLEIIESAEALQKEISKAESFFNSNKNILSIVGGAILVAVLAFFGYKYWVGEQNKAAQAAMYDSVYYFESDSLDLALKGTGGNAGLLEVAENYGSTPAGNLAKFYVGTIYLKQGKFQDAIKFLEGFSSDDLILKGKSYALIGDAYLEQNKNEEAIAAYEKAASYKPNKFITPAYLSKLALAQELAGKKTEAIESYAEIIEKYPASTEVLSATKYKSMLEAEAGQ